jgi:hypothetical protein
VSNSRNHQPFHAVPCCAHLLVSRRCGVINVCSASPCHRATHARLVTMHVRCSLAYVDYRAYPEQDTVTHCCTAIEQPAWIHLRYIPQITSESQQAAHTIFLRQSLASKQQSIINELLFAACCFNRSQRATDRVMPITHPCLQRPSSVLAFHLSTRTRTAYCPQALQYLSHCCRRRQNSLRRIWSLPPSSS